ncbi:MAG: type II toxin-antitoxin system HicB family antitoxin [Chloroflexia bacterium]
MTYNILVVLEKAENNYSAYAPDVPGCIATGKTAEETLRNMREALKGHLEWMANDGDELPQISAVEAHLLTVDVELPKSIAHAP